jgi:GAF domain-containing protein
LTGISREDAIALGDDDGIRAILQEMCDLTGMGFSAVARVSEAQWIAVQVQDGIGFGMKPGDELAIRTTICDEIRQSGRHVVIDDVSTNVDWSRHPVPILYGFKSYASLPLTGADGGFVGTLCAIDPGARSLSAPETVAAMQDLARRIEAIWAR